MAAAASALSTAKNFARAIAVAERARAGGRASVVWEWVGWQVQVQNGEEDMVFRNHGEPIKL